VYLQPNDCLLVDLGGVTHQGKTSFTGSMVSIGWEYFQLDLGFRPHWLSPMSDSSMLMSTEAPTMPSWTISNYEPLSPFGITYQIFEAQMSKSDRIEWHDVSRAAIRCWAWSWAASLTQARTCSAAASPACPASLRLGDRGSDIGGGDSADDQKTPPNPGNQLFVDAGAPSLR
jgi:hypothetical protein